MVYLQITLKIAEASRSSATDVYQSWKVPFLNSVRGAPSKQLLVRSGDVQVLNGFDSAPNAEAYLR